MTNLEERMGHLERRFARARFLNGVMLLAITAVFIAGFSQPRKESPRSDTIDATVMSTDVLRVRRLIMVGDSVHIDNSGFSLLSSEEAIGGANLIMEGDTSRLRGVKLHSGGLQMYTQFSNTVTGKAIFGSNLNATGLDFGFKDPSSVILASKYNLQGRSECSKEEMRSLIEASEGLAGGHQELKGWIEMLNSTDEPAEESDGK